MHFTRIKLQQFRNYPSLDLALHPGTTVLYGANGSGKTNLLEAMHLLSLGRSHRTMQDREMVAAESESAVVLGCTHYAAVKDLIEQILGEIVFFDGATSVAEKLKEVVLKSQKDGLKTNENGGVLPNYQLQIMTSGSNEMRNKFLWWLNRE